MEQDGRKARKKAKKKATKTAAHVLKCLDEQIAACKAQIKSGGGAFAAHDKKLAAECKAAISKYERDSKKRSAGTRARPTKKQKTSASGSRARQRGVTQYIPSSPAHSACSGASISSGASM